MNMKKVAVLPLAVVAMGLTSCNKSWPDITIDKANEIAAKLTEETAKDDWVNNGKISIKGSHKNIKGPTTTNYEESGEFSFNIKDTYMYNYSKEIRKMSSTENPSKYESTSESKERNFFDVTNKKCITTEEYSKKYKEDTEVEAKTEEEYKDFIKECFWIYSGWEESKEFIIKPNFTKEQADLLNSKVKKDSDEFVKYSFKSNGEKNLGLVCNTKVSDVKGTFVETLVEEFKDYKTVEYIKLNIDIKVTDYKPTYLSFNYDIKGIDTNDVALQDIVNSAININYANITANKDLSGFAEKK